MLHSVAEATRLAVRSVLVGCQQALYFCTQLLQLPLRAACVLLMSLSHPLLLQKTLMHFAELHPLS